MSARGLSSSDLSRQSGVDIQDLDLVLDSHMDEAVVRKVSLSLDLDPDCMIALPKYCPKVGPLNGVQQIVLPFGQWTVNSWLLHHEKKNVLFDAGYGPRDLPDHLEGEDPENLFITHQHPDHVGAVEHMRYQGTKLFWPDEMLELRTWETSSLRIKCVDLSGHCSPAVGYLVAGLENDYLVAGDAIFAGSMGGWKSIEAMQLAFETLSAATEDLADEVVILPGHGPPSTIGQEKAANPFRKQIWG